MKRKLTKSVALGVVILAMAACTGKTSNSETTCCETEHAPNNAKTNVITTTVKTKKK